MSQNQRNLAKLGQAALDRTEKVNAELLTFTYGALVTQLLKDFEDVASVNSHLERIGFNIGSRVVEEFLAKAMIDGCKDFRDTAEVIAKVAFRMFLGISAEVTEWNAEFTSCSLVFADNPLSEFVEIPSALHGLSYCGLLCGVLKGALEQLHMRVECRFLKDTLRGDPTNEIRLELKELLREEFVDEDE